MKAQIVSFHCILKDRLGRVLSTSFNQDIINQLEGDAQNLRGLVAGIQDVRAGERRQFTVPAAEAYGVYRPDLVLSVLRSEIPQTGQVIIGSEVRRNSDPLRAYRVVQIDGDSLLLDGNHPLAGEDLTFDIEVVSAREARNEDLETGASSGAGPTFH